MLDRVTALLLNSERVLILFHESPDGDSIASSLALSSALQKLGKEVDLVCRDEIPEVFNFLPDVYRVQNDFILADYDTICTIDCGDIKRTGFPDRVKKFARVKKRLINIDHHLKNDLHKVANINLVDSGAAATAEIIYDLLGKLKIEIDKNLATLLFTGIFTDTGGFQHSNTSPRVYNLASKLLACGAQLRRVSNNISLNKSLVALKIWGVALTRIQRTQTGIVTSFVTQNDLLEIRAVADDTAGAVNIINSIPETKVAILFVEMPNGKIRASLRTEGEIDVSVLAKLFGGGGHKKAAGFTVDGALTLQKNGAWRIKLA